MSPRASNGAAEPFSISFNTFSLKKEKPYKHSVERIQGRICSLIAFPKKIQRPKKRRVRDLPLPAAFLLFFPRLHLGQTRNRGEQRIQQLYREILAVADDNGGKLPNRAMFYCDEFGTLLTIQSAEMMYSASRSRRLSIVSIIQSYQQLEKNYGKEGAAIIQDNCQITIAGGFAPSSETADIISKSLGSRTVMTGSVSRSKNDPSQSLQMTERPLMTADELKSMKKGSFIVMKTGAHPFVSQLKLFMKWGISFPKEAYEVKYQGARRVRYVSRDKLIRTITDKFPQQKKPKPRTEQPSGDPAMTEPAEASTVQEINHAAQQAKMHKPVRTG